ncbi:kinase-like protein [Atractiella rhizophila]|nr:kinase-like protein [Atractiella rhizophila]
MSAVYMFRCPNGVLPPFRHQQATIEQTVQKLDCSLIMKSFFVPLAAFERKLLCEIIEPAAAATLPTAWPLDIDDIFQRWVWVEKFFVPLREELQQDLVKKDYGGSFERAYGDYLHWRAIGRGHAENQFRSDAVKSANPELPVLVANESVDCLHPAIYPDDKDHWRLIHWMWKRDHLVWQQELCKGPTFDIFKSIYSFYHQSTRPSNHPVRFENVEEIMQRIGILSPDNLCELPTTDQINQWHQGMGGSVLDIVESVYRDHERSTRASTMQEAIKHSIGILSPDDLHEVPIDQIKQITSAMNIPYMDHLNLKAKDLRWVEWDPGMVTPFTGHMLHTEDEVFGCCLDNNKYFPGHFSPNGKVVFAMRPVGDTRLFDRQSDFWKAWTDSCLTWNSLNGELLLLETIPGMQYRNLQQFETDIGALEYFRNVTEASMQPAPEYQQYQASDRMLTHPLRHIPSCQLKIDWNYIGKGKNGTVYRATWMRPGSILLSRGQGKKEVGVIVKVLQSNLGNSLQDELKFQQELRMNIGVGSSAVGTAEFFGISSVTLPNTSASLSAAGETQVLVSQFANAGRIMDFIEEKLPHTSFHQSWSLVIGMLSSIANGLHSLHKRGIIHRDLHLNNIMVTQNTFLYQPDGYDSEDTALLIDFGEGQTVDEAATSFRASVPHYQWWHAPEICTRTPTWTFASDIFAFAVTACFILEKRKKLCPAPVPEDVLQRTGLTSSNNTDNILPQSIYAIVVVGLEVEPEKRGNLRDHIELLDNLNLETAEGDDKGIVEWTTLDWWSKVPKRSDQRSSHAAGESEINLSPPHFVMESASE